MTWTPGPWRMEEHAEGKNSWAIWDSLNRLVATTRPVSSYDQRPGSPMRADTNESNARLISLAPELAEALKAVHAEMGRRISAGAFEEFSEPLKTKIQTILTKLEGGGK